LLDNNGFSFKLVLGMVSELPDWLSKAPGLIQIFTWPSLQTVRTHSCVNTKPERGSVWTRWATTGESFGTSRMLGAGCRVPTGITLSQWEDWLPVLKVGDPPGGGHLRNGTTISSISRSHKSNCVSCWQNKQVATWLLMKSLKESKNWGKLEKESHRWPYISHLNLIKSLAKVSVLTHTTCS
jgi:hypothetical protein